jgi:putative ABC transport system permease protein
VFLAEAFRFSVSALRANPIRTGLTALGLVIGNAAVILVVTISLTSREYILEQIQGVGSNMIYAYYETAGPTTPEVEADYLKWGDVEAVRTQLNGRIRAVTGVMTSFDRMMIQGRSDHYYADVRNLVILAGRALDEADVTLRQKVALLTEKLAERLYGRSQAAVGEIIKIHGLQFTVIGVFKERVESFGLSELTRETILIPITVQRYFTPVERIDPLYVQVRRAEDVETVTVQVRALIESRHRPGARYTVENLTSILSAARRIALALTLVLILVAAISLIISGIGVMNIMLVTVTERTREIGIRMAVGASRRDILQQFLLEAILISVSGGFLGVLLGVGIPLTVRFLAPMVPVPISPISVAVAFLVSFAVGVIFGLLPANRAARLNPTEALRYE